MIDQSKKIFPVAEGAGGGITLLEYYAGQAMIGLLYNTERLVEFQFPSNSLMEALSHRDNLHRLSNAAWDIADAMLETHPDSTQQPDGE